MSSLPLLGDRYRLLEFLGEGGMSVVWRGYDEVLGRSVAVKLLTAGYAADNASRARIRAEGRIAAGLSHPHICRVYDYGESTAETGDFVPYLVMELLPGATLADQLRAGPMPVRAALRTCAQVASALAAAHRSGLVHRDIKPGNIILTPSGPKVVDFGIAAAAGELGEPRQDGEIWATPAYVAPERLTGGVVLPASDVYALGLLLYRALAGRAPWQVETVAEILTAHAERDPEPLPDRTGLPAAVRELCLRCLAKDPHQRPTAAEVAESLARAGGWRLSVLAEGGLAVPRGAVPTSSPDGSAVPPAARHPGERARFAQALLAGGGPGRRRWPAPPHPGAGRAPVAVAASAAGTPAPGTPGAAGDPGAVPVAGSTVRVSHTVAVPPTAASAPIGGVRPESMRGPVAPPGRTRSRWQRRRWAAATAASLVAVVTAVWVGAWVPTSGDDRYLGFDVMAAPPDRGDGDGARGRQLPSYLVGAPERSPSAMAAGGGGEMPIDPEAVGGAGNPGMGAGSGAESGMPGGPSGPAPGGADPDPTGPGTGTGTGAPDTDPPAPDPTGTDPPGSGLPGSDPTPTGSPASESPDADPLETDPPGSQSPVVTPAPSPSVPMSTSPLAEPT